MSKIERLLEQESEIADDKILGLWADRNESVTEIAEQLRRKTNNRSLKDD